MHNNWDRSIRATGTVLTDFESLDVCTAGAALTSLDAQDLLLGSVNLPGPLLLIFCALSYKSLRMGI